MFKALLVSCFVLTLALTAQSQVISQWTFEVNTPADVTDSSNGPTTAVDVGNGSSTGFHADALSDWTTPQGNGSANSFSANRWGIGDYFQFSLSTVGSSNIFVTFSQFSSSTGPQTFSLQYSTTGAGGAFNSAGSYTVGSVSYTGSSYDSTSVRTFDLSLVTGLNSNPDVVFRLVSSAVGTAAGSSRVDDFFVSANAPEYDPRFVPVPEPATYMLFGTGFLVCVQQFRRRRTAASR